MGWSSRLHRENQMGSIPIASTTNEGFIMIHTIINERNQNVVAFTLQNWKFDDYFYFMTLVLGGVLTKFILIKRHKKSGRNEFLWLNLSNLNTSYVKPGQSCSKAIHNALDICGDIYISKSRNDFIKFITSKNEE